MSTVGAFFEQEKITKDILVLVSEETPYWEGAAGFIIDKWDFPVAALSHKQERWMDKILQDLTERRITRGFR